MTRESPKRREVGDEHPRPPLALEYKEMRDLPTKEGVTNGRREAPIGKMNIIGRTNPTPSLASTIEPMTVIPEKKNMDVANEVGIPNP